MGRESGSGQTKGNDHAKHRFFRFHSATPRRDVYGDGSGIGPDAIVARQHCDTRAVRAAVWWGPAWRDAWRRGGSGPAATARPGVEEDLCVAQSDSGSEDEDPGN